MVKLSIIGATGYVCGEALRMLVYHPEVKIVSLFDTFAVGTPIQESHPALRGFYDMNIEELTEENVRKSAAESDVVFIVVPSGDVARWAKIAVEEGAKPLDIGADLRFPR